MTLDTLAAVLGLGAFGLLLAAPISAWIVHSMTDPDLRSHEPPRNSGEGTAVNGPMPLAGGDDANAPA